MTNVHELVRLAQEMSASIDDFDKEAGLFNIDYKGQPSLTLSAPMFLKTFKGFNIRMLDHEYRFKFVLSKVIQGVEFRAYANDLNGLREIQLVRRYGVKKGHEKSLRALQCE